MAKRTRVFRIGGRGVTHTVRPEARPSSWARPRQAQAMNRGRYARPSATTRIRTKKVALGGRMVRVAGVSPRSWSMMFKPETHREPRGRKRSRTGGSRAGKVYRSSTRRKR